MKTSDAMRRRPGGAAAARSCRRRSCARGIRAHCTRRNYLQAGALTATETLTALSGLLFSGRTDGRAHTFSGGHIRALIRVLFDVRARN